MLHALDGLALIDEMRRRGVRRGYHYAVFLIVCVSLTSHYREPMDNEILNTAREFDVLYETHGLEALKAEFQRDVQQPLRI